MARPLPTMHKSFIGAVEDEWQLYSDRAEDYTVGPPIGFGASSVVYQATYHPPPTSSSPIPVALKVVNLDKLPVSSLTLLQRETTLMSLSKHPNLIRVRGSWMDGHKLFIAMRLMSKGSAADVMRYNWSGGMEEDVVRCILRQALQGLNYLHVNDFIHRDIKAANLLIDDDGTVLLGDLGVAANMADDFSHSNAKQKERAHSVSAASAVSEPHQVFHSNHEREASGESSKGRKVVLVDTPVPPRPNLMKRKSFVGTPCWMSPELIQGHQYDSAADIWSFGITALELTQGRPPRSREHPSKVLLKTIQEDPPTLDREGGTYKYSKAFKEIIDHCLVKDPTKRPTAEELLNTPFFKTAKKKSYLVSTVLKDLPPLALRQERRVTHNTLIHPSVASWDFAATLQSATASLFLHSRHPSTPVEGGVFEMEGDANADADSMFDLDSPSPRSSRFSQHASWPTASVSVTKPDPVEVQELPPTTEASEDSSTSPSESEQLSESEGADLGSASSPPTSDAGGLLDSAAASRHNSSSKPPPPLPTATDRSSASVPVPKRTESSSSRIPQAPAVSSLTSSSPQVSDSPSKFSGSPSSGGGLWNRIKSRTNGVKHSSSKAELKSSPDEKEKEKRGILGRKTSASASLTVKR